MAVTNNIWLRGARQKLGGVVLYQAQGETRMRELAPSVSNPRTDKQMAQRVRWANLVNFYRANASWMQRAFENKPQNNTDYNRFMSLNGGTSNIYLTKSEANAGACIVAPYRVTEGTLSSIDINKSGENWVTNIFTGELSALISTTTVGAFAQAVLGSNAGIRQGDQISFIRMSQQTNPTTGYPYILIRKYEVLMNPSSQDLLSDFLPLDYIAIESAGENNCVRITNSGNAGGFVMVLSRTEGGTIRVSSQDVVVANNDALITRYSSVSQQQTAAQSYGEGTEVFLSSASANEINPFGMDNSILRMVKGQTNYQANEYVGMWEDFDGVTIRVHFSTPITASTVTGTMTFKANNSLITEPLVNPIVDSGVVEATTPEMPGGNDEDILVGLSVMVEGITYSISFSDDNELG